MINRHRQSNRPEDQDRGKIAKRKISPNDGGLDRSIQPQMETYQAESLEQSVVFQQSRGWSRGIVWTIMGITTGLIAWACLAPLEEAVSVQGKLEPIDKVKDVQVPVGGVVQQVLVKDGQKVTAGQNLLNLESTVAKTTLASLQTNLNSLAAESRFYHSLLAQGANSINSQSLAKLNIQPEILALTSSRSSLIAENQLYRAELNGASATNLTSEQRQRLQSSLNERNTRIVAGESEIGQVRKQIAENRVKRQGLVDRIISIKTNIASINTEIARSNDTLATTLSQIDRQISQNQAKSEASQKNLVINQRILSNLKPAGDAGAIAATQIQRQEQEVVTRSSEVEQLTQEQSRLQLEKARLISTSKTDVQRQQQRLQEQQQLLTQSNSEIAQLDRESERLQLSVNQNTARLENSKEIGRKDLFAKIADNDKKIAEIDGQLNKTIVEIDRKIADLNTQITQAKTNLKYQQVLAPVSGTVFELKANTPGFVANPSEPVLKIVPDNNLNAKVFITNKDIGFVKEGMTVDVRLDTFPFSEFGDVKGKIISIGSDVLPPDQQHPYERFPAVIKLEKQNLVIKGKAVTLQSGMALSANIKLRDRTVMSIFTDMLAKQQDALKTVR